MVVKSKKVKIFRSWKWKCPKCKFENFTDCEIVGLSQEDKARLMREHGIFGAQTGDFVTSPTFVECNWCRKTFETKEG